MITGLRFNKIVKVELDRFNKVTVLVDGEEERVGVKEVPYVRYQFKEYTDEVIQFIYDVKRSFEHSVHIIDIDIFQAGVQNAIAERLKNIFDNGVAIFGSIDINDDVLDSINMLDVVVEGLNTIAFDRVILRDKSTRLDQEKFIRLRKHLFQKHVIKEVGLCESPFTDVTNCCLSAERSRHLAAKYGDSETATAVLTHQGGLCTGCSCVKSVLVDNDLLPKETAKKSSGESKKNSSGEKKPKGDKPVREAKPKKPKVAKVPDEWFS